MANNKNYAVVFKIHFWDDFVARQLNRLMRRAGNGQIFIIVDETRGRVDGIEFDHVIRMTEFTLECEGYLRYPKDSTFWYNTDYQIYHFFDHNPQFDYLFICEYDCLINFEIGELISAMARQGLEFVGEKIRTPPQHWYWTRYAQPYYQPGMLFSGRLVCCAAFSQNFARQLQAARRDHTQRVLAGTMDFPPDDILWPNNEAFIGAEIERLSVASAELSAFFDTSKYDWGPPHPEFALSYFSHLEIIHPLLSQQHYFRGIAKSGWQPTDIFNEKSLLHIDMEQFDPASVVAMFVEHFCDLQDFVSLSRIKQYAAERGLAARDRAFNVARGKPATQSSTCQWSRRSPRSADAGGAVNGEITGGYGFHTDMEDGPWWCLDLETVLPVVEIRIHNRLELKHRAASLLVQFSTDLLHWCVLYQDHDHGDFGGADGHPLRIAGTEPVEMRFLRLSLPGRGMLHIDEVEVFV